MRIALTGRHNDAKNGWRTRVAEVQIFKANIPALETNT
jgi:hypothetical protein